MIKNTAFLKLLAAVVGLTFVGCTQQKTAQDNKSKVYYHDRKVGVGSNIPRSYSDSTSVNTGGGDQSSQQLQEMQRNSANQGGITTGTGGR